MYGVYITKSTFYRVLKKICGLARHRPPYPHASTAPTRHGLPQPVRTRTAPLHLHGTSPDHGYGGAPHETNEQTPTRWLSSCTACMYELHRTEQRLGNEGMECTSAMVNLIPSMPFSPGGAAPIIPFPPHINDAVHVQVLKTRVVESPGRGGPMALSGTHVPGHLHHRP